MTTQEQATATAPSAVHLNGNGSRSSDRRGPHSAPIVVGVDESAASEAAARAAIALAWRLGAPVVFVYVRRGPSPMLGEPFHQRQLDAEIAAGDRALGNALALADRAGVMATAEQLEGRPAKRIVEFAKLRAARLVVMGSRRRWLKASVSKQVLRGADRPVMVTAGPG